MTEHTHNLGRFIDSVALHAKEVFKPRYFRKSYEHLGAAGIREGTINLEAGNKYRGIQLKMHFISTSSHLTATGQEECIVTFDALLPQDVDRIASHLELNLTESAGLSFGTLSAIEIKKPTKRTIGQPEISIVRRPAIKIAGIETLDRSVIHEQAKIFMSGLVEGFNETAMQAKALPTIAAVIGETVSEPVVP